MALIALSRYDIAPLKPSNRSGTMQQILEFIPIALFFITYQMSGQTISLGDWQYTLDGIFSATLVLMLATTLQLIVAKLTTGHIEKRLFWTWLAVVIFGSLTVSLRDQAFIQWKPTIFNWALALVFLASHWVGEKNLLQRSLGSQLKLPKHMWRRLSFVWIANFSVVGALNIWVAKAFSEATWVSYKLYSSIGFTLFMMIITVIMIAPQIKEENQSENSL
jgi:intracellular septation protein